MYLAFFLKQCGCQMIGSAEMDLLSKLMVDIDGEMTETDRAVFPARRGAVPEGFTFKHWLDAALQSIQLPDQIVAYSSQCNLPKGLPEANDEVC